jgi:hypothetical protein
MGKKARFGPPSIEQAESRTARVYLMEINAVDAPSSTLPDYRGPRHPCQELKGACCAWCWRFAYRAEWR